MTVGWMQRSLHIIQIDRVKLGEGQFTFHTKPEWE